MIVQIDDESIQDIGEVHLGEAETGGVFPGWITREGTSGCKKRKEITHIASAHVQSETWVPTKGRDMVRS